MGLSNCLQTAAWLLLDPSPVSLLSFIPSFDMAKSEKERRNPLMLDVSEQHIPFTKLLTFLEAVAGICSPFNHTKVYVNVIGFDKKSSQVTLVIAENNPVQGTVLQRTLEHLWQELHDIAFPPAATTESYIVQTTPTTETTPATDTSTTQVTLSSQTTTAIDISAALAQAAATDLQTPQLYNFPHNSPTIKQLEPVIFFLCQYTWSKFFSRMKKRYGKFKEILQSMTVVEGTEVAELNGYLTALKSLATLFDDNSTWKIKQLKLLERDTVLASMSDENQAKRQTLISLFICSLQAVKQGRMKLQQTLLPLETVNTTANKALHKCA